MLPLNTLRISLYIRSLLLTWVNATPTVKAQHSCYGVRELPVALFATGMQVWFTVNMKPILRIFLDLLLAVSLAVTPVGVALAAIDAGNDQPAHNVTTEPCHQSGQKQASTVIPEKASMIAPSPTSALPTSLTANPVMASHLFVTALPDSYKSLRLPPDSPPPLA